MQFNWQPVMKFVPTDGVEEVMDLREVFTDTSGPGMIDANHLPEQTKRNDVNRRNTSVGWGFRPTCKFTIQLISTELHQYLALMVNRLMKSDVWACFLSLDGGLTFREVQLKSYSGPKPIGGKNFVGAEYVVDIEGVELLTQVPALQTGVW
jgi:hypothetical protein